MPAHIRTLLIEDCTADAARMRAQVRRATARPHEITHAASLAVAIDLLQREAFDAILLDQHLPDTTGPKAVAALKGIPDCPPIVMLGASDPSDAELAIAAGAQDYVSKSMADGHTLYRSIRYAIERHASQLQLHHLATVDGVTGLPNRSLFQRCLRQGLGLADRNGTDAALLYLDLDGFKDVNDTLGHDAGDELLKLTAGRLRRSLRDCDQLGRLGGDEFAVLLVDVEEGQAAAIAQDLIRIIGQPILIHETEVRVSASVGIATTKAGIGAQRLLRQADLAMYCAKKQGGSTWRFFEPHLQTEVDRRIQRQGELRQAFDSGDFRLHYQPILDLGLEAPVGYEALARWVRKDNIELGGSFIPDIEHGNLAIPFGCWVIREACEQLAQIAANGSTAYIAVNVCARQVLSHVRETTLVQAVREALAATGAPAAQLVVEVTEGTFVHDLDRTSRILTELRQLGVRVAIDDFGTGYSSLQYLARLPVDTLKIDGSFVKSSNTPRGRALLQAIVALGDSVGMEVIAEWVETAAHAQMLREMGCGYAQGWHFGAAQPAERICWNNQTATPMPPLRLIG